MVASFARPQSSFSDAKKTRKAPETRRTDPGGYGRDARGGHGLPHPASLPMALRIASQALPDAGTMRAVPRVGVIRV